MAGPQVRVASHRAGVRIHDRNCNLAEGHNRHRAADTLLRGDQTADKGNPAADRRHLADKHPAEADTDSPAVVGTGNPAVVHKHPGKLPEVDTFQAAMGSYSRECGPVAVVAEGRLLRSLDRTNHPHRLPEELLVQAVESCRLLELALRSRTHCQQGR